MSCLVWSLLGLGKAELFFSTLRKREGDSHAGKFIFFCFARCAWAEAISPNHFFLKKKWFIMESWPWHVRQWHVRKLLKHLTQYSPLIAVLWGDQWNCLSLLPCFGTLEKEHPYAEKIWSRSATFKYGNCKRTYLWVSWCQFTSPWNSSG